jgi:hypothetical protein
MRLTETPTEKSPREIGIKKPTAGNQSIDGSRRVEISRPGRNEEVVLEGITEIGGKIG